ncbi:MAG: aldo/keto reductase [Rhodospirillales bacterium]|nr:aldo/keto reductase [Rhodospirillales bacterium]
MSTSTRFVPHGPLGMGGAPLGNLFARIPDEVAAATIQAAWDSDIRHFDTAPHYGAGLSEHRVGAVLRHFPRDEYTLSTKVGRMLDPVPGVPEMDENFAGGLSFRRRLDYGYDATLRSIEDSLQRLGLSRIDIAYIHDCAPDWLGDSWREQFDIAMKGAARALTRLREEGVIRAWGLGVNVVEPCLLTLQQADPDLFLVAGRYTLLDHAALGELLPACARRDVHVVVGGPYNSGLLAGGTTFNYEAAPADILARARAIGAACARHGVDLKAAALQFCAAHPVVAAVIPGPRTPEEVRQNAAAMTQPIPLALWGELKAAGLLPSAAPTPEM